MVLVGAAALGYWAFGGGSPERDSAADAGGEPDPQGAGEDQGLTWLLRGDPDAGPGSAEGTSASAGPPGDRGSGEGSRGWPDERRAEARQRVEIVPLGPDAPNVRPDDVLDSLAAQRPVMQECVREAGGFSTIWQKIHDPEREANAKGGFGLTFDVGTEGKVAPDSFEMRPAPMEPFGGCIRRAVEGASMPPPGPDGARIGLDFRSKRAKPLDAGAGSR